MPGVSALGTVSYNGFTFPPACDCKVSVKDVLLSSNMGKKYSLFTFTISFALSSSDLGLSNGASIDSAFTEARRQLSHHAGTFTFSGQGLGTFPPNSGSGFVVTPQDDMEFGPKVNIQEWEDLGNGKCIHIVWQCTCALVDCDTAVSGRAMGEFSYGISWDWASEDGGMSTRTIQGQLEAHVSRDGNDRLTGTADDNTFLDQFLKNLKWLDGFHRSVRRSLSPDRRTLSFTITETEIPSDNPLEPNILQARVRHSIRSQSTALANLWTNTFTATYTVAPGFPRSIAFQAFSKLVLSRIRAGGLGGNAGIGGGSTSSPAVPNSSGGNSSNSNASTGSGSSGSGNSIVMINSFEVSEDVYGRDVDISITYTITASLESILKASGIFTPVDAKWSDWSASIEKLVGQRGIANLGHKPEQDIIVSFCDEGATPPKVDDKATKKNADGTPASVTKSDGNGYIYYTYAFYFERVTNTLLQTPTGEGDATYQLEVSDSSADLVTSAGRNNVVQERAPSFLYLVLEANAIRVGQRPTPPRVKQIGGEATIVVTDTVWIGNRGADAAGKPIYQMECYRSYYIPKGHTGKVEVQGLPPEATRDSPNT